jgi:S-DNA-T family DNA segregation ATPase FtsK/SpoIIIE
MAGRIRQEVIGIFSLMGGLYAGLSLATYDKWDRSLFTFSEEPVRNYGGVVGASLADLLFTLLGASALAVPAFLVAYGLKRLLGKEKDRVHLAGAVLFLAASSLLLSLLDASFGLDGRGGGVLGLYGGALLVTGLHILGAYMLAVALFLTSLVLLSPVSVVKLLSPRGRFSRAEKKPGLRRRKAAREDLFPEEEDETGGEPPGPLVVEPPLEVISPQAAGGGPLFEKAVSPEGYRLPDIDLLARYDPVERQGRQALMESSALLENKLSDFSVQGRVTHVHTGPVVTMYEFEPAPGVKINRVVSLSEDLALALRAQSIRISAVPGKAAIGIEIPNPRREVVSLREVIASEDFAKSSSHLTFAIGKDIFGSSVVADLARMPHLLVAGATGSGKSVFLNATVVSLLCKSTPGELRMLMIDPKLLELSAYDGIPHLICPVITNPKEASEMLRRMVFEMERRYHMIAQRGVRNIESFNVAAPEEERLPYIVILIDELADLMLAAQSQVEDSIARLAQMARASGIHLILATQRPSVDVITGVIKANFPARVAFQVTSRVDSRTILDAQGAEQLIGKGDMLFMLPGTRIMRVHGAFVSEKEVKRVADFVRGQGGPDYALMEEIAQAENSARADAAQSEDRDELYERALVFGDAAGEVSISSLQRRLKIGYNRAARIMELMEEDGLVGPPRGAGKPRDFLGRRGGF